MYSHVTVGSADIARSKAFYLVAFAPLGLEVKFEDRTMVAFGPAAQRRPMFIALLPENRQPMNVGNGTMAAFDAPTRAIVDAFHAAAIAAGATDEGKPGLRPHYHRHYYGAYVRDPDGNKLCAVCHREE